ncbi:hypothetical protein TCAL_11167 [Tigriopus californicus]|uniref:Glucose-methanol-choline oxidoreductase N-terminal domain-containing protein n=1 Tax=Tigriopus californicus TaxID=6832 RepID=A0A553NF21_TIGCA|nr:hypothetical protein TCAL_11167 [Tigriopus californicus]
MHTLKAIHQPPNQPLHWEPDPLPPPTVNSEDESSASTRLVKLRRTESVGLMPSTPMVSSGHLGFVRLYSVSSPSEIESKWKPSFFKPKLVIFDKDGTLVCFHTMWSPWCTSLAQRMHSVTGQDLSTHLYDVLGYDHSENKVRIGALAENTHPQIRVKIEAMLTENRGFSEVEAKQAVASSWKDTPEDMKVKMTGDCHDLFNRLKNEGVKIAICTSDSREGTEEFLRRQNLNSLVEMSVCGDDSFSKPKPDPHNALYICDKLNVRPSDTIMVGDTPADTLMGQQAKLGLTVGVLTGVGGKTDLADADVIVDDVEECVDMLLPHPTSVRSRVHQVTSRGIAKIAQGSLFLHASGDDANSFRAFSTSARCSGASNSSSSEKTYSHIVVGAGSAGCVLANQAGPKDTILNSKLLQWKIHMPAALMYNLCDDKYNWYYHTLPQEHCNNRVMYWPRGRVWGGSSSLNAMVYIRGHAYDYDRWQNEGAEGWNYFGCLPYFKKAQNHQLGGDDYRGGSGPLNVSRRNWDNPLHSVFLEAGQQAGHSFTQDVNGYQQAGMSWFDMTIRDGQRWSAASAYLRPALERSNLNAEVEVLVTKILFDGKKAIGIEYEHKGQRKQVYGEEIILSGGAINSPQLLMLSGIGDAAHLKSMDIPLVEHVPGVGQNLQDHLELYVVQKCKSPVTLLGDQKGARMIQVGLNWFYNQSGPARTAHLESGGFAYSRPEVEHPDIMFHFLPSQVVDHGRQAPDTEAFQVHVGPMRPTSRGWVKLKSKSPRDHPLIQPNYLSTEIDRWEMRESVRLSREIFAQPAFDSYRDGELVPGIDTQSDAELDEFARAKSDSAYHPSCTCKMGSSTDNMAVVDSSTKVMGVENLRVVDASIMPSVASGNLNAPTIMLAERAADIIRGRELLPAIPVPVYETDVKKSQRQSKSA